MKRILLLPIFLIEFFIAVGQNPDLENANQPVLLGTNVNTDFPEVKPLISPDGKTLFFSRRNCPDNIQGEKDFQDIWVSHMDEAGEWTTATNLGNVVNDKYANAICAISPDGKMGVFYNTYGKLEHPLAKATLLNNQWTTPEPIVIKNYYNYNEFSDFFTCFKTNVLFMAIERDDTHGDQDIYISLLDDNGNYGEPINLGDKINTSSADFAPFLAADGKTLLFASYGHKGLGGSDIFMSQRLNDSWTEWSTPVNLGPEVNTENNETYFSLTGDFRYIYLDSFTPLGDRRDIARLMMPDALRPRQFKESTLAPKMSYNNQNAESINP